MTNRNDIKLDFILNKIKSYNIELVIISAFSHNRVIGLNGTIPWFYDEDLLYFKNKTLGNVIIMGRKTYDSIKNKPLKNRFNIVLTKNEYYDLSEQKENNLFFAKSVSLGLRKAYDYCKKNSTNKIYIIGGQEIYNQLIKYVDKLEITRINKKFLGDTFFPTISRSKWTKISSVKENELTFETYIRK
jgi:dihydrofolate reductase